MTEGENMSIKSDIINLINSDEGSVKLNHFTTLYRCTNLFGTPVDRLKVEFGGIDRFSSTSKSIVARDYEGIIAEVQQRITEHFLDIADSLNRELANGYKRL